VDTSIIEFIAEHHLLTLATSNNNIPYCCNVYYVFNQQTNSLIFASDGKTIHVQHFTENPKVAGTIALETLDIEKIQGVQLLGEVSELIGEEFQNTKKHYLKSFPYAEKMDPKLWEMKLTFIKMTHNKLGFGKKLVWEENHQ
jgi:uncharacterized protein YhbP (UPF0306 family)